MLPLVETDAERNLFDSVFHPVFTVTNESVSRVIAATRKGEENDKFVRLLNTCNTIVFDYRQYTHRESIKEFLTIANQNTYYNVKLEHAITERDDSTDLHYMILLAFNMIQEDQKKTHFKSSNLYIVECTSASLFRTCSNYVRNQLYKIVFHNCYFREKIQLKRMNAVSVSFLNCTPAYLFPASDLHHQTETVIWWVLRNGYDERLSDTSFIVPLALQRANNLRCLCIHPRATGHIRVNGYILSTKCPLLSCLDLAWGEISEISSLPNLVTLRHNGYGHVPRSVNNLHIANSVAVGLPSLYESSLIEGLGLNKLAVFFNNAERLKNIQKLIYVLRNDVVLPIAHKKPSYSMYKTIQPSAESIKKLFRNLKVLTWMTECEAVTTTVTDVLKHVGTLNRLKKLTFMGCPTNLKLLLGKCHADSMKELRLYVSDSQNKDTWKDIWYQMGQLKPESLYIVDMTTSMLMDMLENASAWTEKLRRFDVRISDPENVTEILIDAARAAFKKKYILFTSDCDRLNSPYTFVKYVTKYVVADDILQGPDKDAIRTQWKNEVNRLIEY